MRTAVVGAGPVGMVVAWALAQRGEQVLLIDPDPGPEPTGEWRRLGVMQFRHPHFFRHQMRHVLERHAPELWDAVVAAGAVVNPPPPDLPADVTTVACRRSTFESALRRALPHERITLVTGYAESVVVEGDRVTGVVVDGQTLAVERVLVATGRTGGFGDDLRPAGEGGHCGVSYVSRMYRAREGVEPMATFRPLGAQYDGYGAIAFPQDAGTLSALVLRPSKDRALAGLTRTDAFETAVSLIPNLAPWTDPERFEPITEVMRGGTLTNSYRGQGTPPAGVFFAGDAVSTTNPSAGRGASLGLMQAGALLDALAEHADPKDASASFDAWCTEQVRPWYEDHVDCDAARLQRYAGEPLDPEGPLASDVYGAALDVEPSLAPVVMPYLGMVTLPASLAAGEQTVRALLRGGWRPPPADGPTRDELADRIGAREAGVAVP